MATLKPDAYAVLYQGDFEDRLFIEVDLGTEDGPRILAKARTFMNYWRSGKEQESTGIFPLVCWVTDTEQRRDFLARTLRPTAGGGAGDSSPSPPETTSSTTSQLTTHGCPDRLSGHHGQPDPPKEVNP